MVVNSILPLLQRHHSSTIAAISCLTDILDAGRSNEIAQDTAQNIFDRVIPTVTLVLSFGNLYPKAKYEGPRDDTKLVERVASFYCQLLSTRHEKEANMVLLWLRREIDTAENRIFHAFVLPFLERLYDMLQKYEQSVSDTLQETCQHMVLVLLTRCVGMEPAKPTTWTRSPCGCESKDCPACPKLDEFLKDPGQEVGYFEDDEPIYGFGHLHGRAGSGWSRQGHHECVPGYEMWDGRKMLKIKKSNYEWTFGHEQWEIRYKKVSGKLKNCLQPARALLGERYEELVEMRPVKIVTESG